MRVLQGVERVVEHRPDAPNVRTNIAAWRGVGERGNERARFERIWID
jgi:hypothetical protein